MSAPAARAEFTLPVLPGQQFVVGTTAEIQAFRALLAQETGSPEFSPACDARLWPDGPWVPSPDCAWELGDGSVDCTATNGWYWAASNATVAAAYALLDVREQPALPQICLDRLALQYCGYNPPSDWPVSCWMDGYCCQD